MKGLIFTYVMTYGGAVVALFNPFVGLLIYVCFAIIRPESLWHWAVPPGNYSRIVGIALLLGWLFRGFGSWQFGRATGTVVLLLSFLGWTALSTVQCSDQLRGWSFFDDLCKVVLPFLVGITLIDSYRHLRLLAWVIVVSQGYVALEMNLAYYNGQNIIHDYGFSNMDNNCVAIAMVACTGLAFFVGINEKDWKLKFVAHVFCVLMIHSVLMAFSRGGMLALILTGLVSFVLLPKRPIVLCMFVLMIGVGVRLAGPQVLQRFSTTFASEAQRDESAGSRLKLWADCWDVMQKYPIAGLGPRHWPLVASDYGWPAGKEAHSLWMQTGAELGFPGLFFLSGFYGWTVIRLWPIARNKGRLPDVRLVYLAQGVIASIIGFAISAQFVSLIGLESPYYIVLVGAGVLRVASNAAPSPNGATIPMKFCNSVALFHGRRFIGIRSEQL